MQPGELDAELEALGAIVLCCPILVFGLSLLDVDSDL